MEAATRTAIITPATSASQHQTKVDTVANDDVLKMQPPVFYQAKLTVSPPDDPLEHEADSVADKVMRMPQLVQFSSSKNTVHRKCAACEKEEKVHRKESDGTGMIASPIVHEVLNTSPGKSMESEARTFMEPRFNYDFSSVKIHDGEQAAKSASSINALAYTSGNNIVFNSGQYNTASDSGKRLLAHELTHVVQQEGGQTTIQKFGATEHKNAGDEASKKFSAYNQPLSFEIGNGKIPFVLTFGDLTMLSGDLFDPRDTVTGANGVQQPNPDSLFTIASKQSSDPGLQPGTQDEIIFAIYDNDKSDPRFLKNGIWEMLPEVFEKKDPVTKEYLSKNVRKAVKDRYLLLASKNYEHFVQPTGKDLGPLAGLGASAGGSYRALHEDAILRAYQDAQKGELVSSAQMREAAAQHFLQDYFSAGHLRTPRKAIDDHWLKKYPLFFENMKKKIALDMSRYINANTTNAATIFGTVSVIFDKIYADVQAQTNGLPPIGIGAILGEVMHHNDNEVGVWVTNRLGHRWLDYGDSNLNKKFQLSNPDTHKYANNRTPEMIAMAVKFGIEDIQNAYNLGKQDTFARTTASILDHTKKEGTDMLAKPTDLYAPEMVFPQLDTAVDNGDISAWKASSIEDLWNLYVRTDRPETYGQLITTSLLKGEISGQLGDLLKKIPATKRVYKWGLYVGTVLPQDAFLHGFLEPLQSNPLGQLKAIIDYNPSEGQAFFNVDDAVVEEMATMDKQQRKGFTLKQRSDRIKSMVDCTFCYVSTEEGELVIQLFETAEPKDRATLYQMVEGHAWKGDWVRGAFTSDDDIWNGLNRGQLDRLRKIINQR